MTIRVLIADDHPVVRDGLRFSIERGGKDFEIVGEATSGKEVLAFADSRGADVYVLDVTMPGMSGIETVSRLLDKCPDARIVMLSFHDTRPFVEAALKAGAQGYVTKESVGSSIIQALLAVVS